MIKAIIFDFDGLILDTEMPEYLSNKEMFEEHGQEFPLEEWGANIGRGWDEPGMSPYETLQSKLSFPVDIETLRVKRRKRNEAMILENCILPGVVKVLNEAKAKGLKLGVASSSSIEWVGGHLSRLGLLERFDILRCSDHVTKTKPHPELYLSAIEALGVFAHEAIALEDSRNGSLAAKAAGLYTIVIPNEVTRHSNFSHADSLLSSLGELSLDHLLVQFHKRTEEPKHD